ncbi:hypothetical protein [Desulfonatronovibrio hydrogenovorans]|uniref:hypothetical protein n=1 Tax=Desulfonatronovibrio hydrogenovorans TaxID=53245 RepID=UPI00048D8E45|nr:hypothetical protein [Desulfonatronovibrio hydrogenovorans]
MILASLVGNQPGAIAVVAKTLLDNQGLEKVYLLPTRKTGVYAKSLQELLKTWNVEADILSNSISAIGLKSISDNHKASGLYFNVSPGMNFHLASLAADIDPDLVLPVYASDSYLHDLKQDKSWELPDLGIDNLLKLHLVSLNYQKSVGRGLFKESSLSFNEKEVIRLDFCFESKGKIIGLVSIKGSTRDEINSQCRKIADISRSASQLNDLQPRLFIRSKDKLAIKRMLAYGFDPIEDFRHDKEQNREKLRKLLYDKKISAPNSETFTDNQLSKVIAVSEGKGGTGPDLLVSLGNDPASTIQAIMAHEPGDCYLAYDKKSKYISDLTGRLCQMAHRLPVNRLIPLKTDLIGSNLNINTLPDLFRDKPIIVNVSPGTKAQCWNMTLDRDKSSVFTLDNNEKSSRSLDSSRSYPYAAIPVALQAETCGGPLLKDKAISFEDFLKNEDWCEAMLKHVLKVARQKRSKENSVSLNLLERQRHGVSYKRLDTDRIVVQVMEGGQTFKHICRSKSKHDGFWLEPVVAYGFLRAGKEKICDMMLNVAWSWDVVEGKNDHFHGELDIVINWEGTFLGVSCKQGYSGHEDPVSAYEQAKTDVIGVSKFGLGRFAVPILVGPLVQGAARESGEERLLELNLVDFAQPEKLIEKIDSHIQSLRSFSS